MPFVWLLPVALIVATAVAAELFGQPIESPLPPSPTIASEEVGPTPTPSPEPTILGTQTTEPNPTPTTTPTPTPTTTPKTTTTVTPTATTEATSGELGISFVDLPNTLSAGQKTKVTIKIDGPAGTKGDNAKIKVKYHTSEEKNNSSSSIKTDISNSFGSFTTPATFPMNLSLGQEKAPIELTASAEINGQTVETTRTVILN